MKAVYAFINYYENLALIPNSWIYAPLGKLGTFTRGSGIKRNETCKFGYPCIRYGELYTTYKGSIHKIVSFVPLEIFVKSKKIHKNDVLMALTGENKEDISTAVAYLGEDDVAMGGDMTSYSSQTLHPLYTTYVINSPYGLSCRRNLATGDIIVHMSNDKLSSIVVPVPPINEQNIIVKKVQIILKKIDNLIF